MPRYSRSRSRTPARRRRRRSYSSSSRSQTRSRSPLRGSRKYRSHNRKASRGHSRSRTPQQKDHRGYKSSSSKQRGRRSRSYTPEKHRYKEKTKSGSRSPHHTKMYWSPKRSPQQSDQQKDANQIPEGPQLPPDLGAFREDYGKPVQTTDQQGGNQSKYTSRQSHSAERSYNEKTNYEAVSPEELRFSPKSQRRSQSPYDRKISKIKLEPQPQYYQVQEKYLQDQQDISGRNYMSSSSMEQQKAAPSPIIRPIFDPFSVKIPRRKDEGLKAIFDRPELTSNFAPGQTQLEEPLMERKEPVVYRQDIQFTSTLPVGGFPPQPHGFIERREPLILGLESRRDMPFDPSMQYPPRDGSTAASGPYLSQPLTYHVQPSNQFGPVREVQHVGDFSRQGMFVPETTPMMSSPPLSQSPMPYQYPPDDMPDIKGPHDLRYDLESRRKQLEHRRDSRSRSKTRSHRGSSLSRPRDVSRSGSRSPRYKSYQQRDSQDHQKGQSRRPIRERLGNVSQGLTDSSFSDDDDNDVKPYRWTQRNTFYSHKQQGQSGSHDQDASEHISNKKSTTKKQRGVQRGGFRGWDRGRNQGRGRGYLGKNFIPGYNRGARGKFTQANRRGSRRSPTSMWTHDLFDKHKDEDNGDGEARKEKKKLKTDKDKEKKSVKQKTKTAKKAKKSKKSPGRGETNQKTKDFQQAAVKTDTPS